jgi:hypothetical protein
MIFRRRTFYKSVTQNFTKFSLSSGRRVVPRHSPMGAQLGHLGNLELAHLPGTLRYGRKGLWVCSVSLSPGELCEGNLQGDSLAGDP